MWVVVIPLGVLAVNLSAAIITNKRINQQPGLLVFHVSLLGLVILAGVGRLTHLDAHLELPLGQEFTPDTLIESRAGVFHSGDLDLVSFVQGPFTVQYAAGLKRGLTHSHIKVRNPFRDPNGKWEERVIGDDRPLVMEGYRFYTTHNKGFAPVLTWIPDHGEPVTGTINMPSYPLFDYKQDNRWQPPGGEEIKFWLRLDTGMTQDASWTLDLRNSAATLVVTSNDERREIVPGESVRLPDGELRFDKLTMWMGYRVFYDPTIQWMFFVSIAGVLGLGHYFWRKLNLQPWVDEPAGAAEPQNTGRAFAAGSMKTTMPKKHA
jgi:cytochrome c biogenesis protein